jgi:hypothetical protein
MVKPTIKIVLSVIALFIIVYVVDSIFFRNLFWERLISNIVIVLVFAVIYLKYLNKEYVRVN